MVKKSLMGLAAIALAALSATVAAQDAKTATTAPAVDAKTALANVAKAMGADNVKTIQYSGSGTNAGLGQNKNPNVDPLAFMKSYTRQIDFSGPTSQVKLVRLRDGKEETETQTILPTASWDVQCDLWLSPFGFLKGAMANNATLESATVKGEPMTIATFTLQNKYKVNGYIDAKNMIRKVETWVDNPVFGDMLVEAVYDDYQDFGGVKFPSMIVEKAASHKTLILIVSDVKPNVSVNIQAPEQNQAAVAPPQPMTVQTQKIADGVFYLTGGALHSVAVEFADYVAVIEAPQNEQRSLAVIREVKKLTHNKPIRYLINTHHHFDHAGGLRTYVDEGATIITQDINRDLFEATLSTPRTLSPDKLTASKKAPNIETVLDRIVLEDKTRTLELDLIKDSPHDDGILMAYLPKEKILVEADVYTAPARNAPATGAVNPLSANLVQNLERLKVDVDRILPLQGPGVVATRADLYKAAGKVDKAVAKTASGN